MKKTIYVKLLEEGTQVFRPVPAIELRRNVYELKGQDIYDPEDEIWEFKPGVHVLVQEQELNGKLVLVAVREEGFTQDDILI